MRVSDKMAFDQVNHNLGRNRTELNDLQNQAATQKKINKPSDDPLSTTRVLAGRTEIGMNAQFLKNINIARSFLEYSDQSIGELGDVLMRAKELAISQANDASAGPSTRQITATEIAQLRQQSIQIANRKLGDRFLFGGYRTTSAPFSIDGSYSGDDGEIQLWINKEARVGINVPGGQVFLGHSAYKKPEEIEARSEKKSENQNSQASIRAPASIESSLAAHRKDQDSSELDERVAEEQEPLKAVNLSETWSSSGVNIFDVLSNFEIALRANDKAGIQEATDQLDAALAQVVMARSQVGSKVATLNNNSESIQKGQVETKTMVSNLQDVDTFELVSDINKSESALKASLTTSGKLLQPSLLDFLR